MLAIALIVVAITVFSDPLHIVISILLTMIYCDPSNNQVGKKNSVDRGKSIIRSIEVSLLDHKDKLDRIYVIM